MSGELKPPIILFGNFRSGTTMLQKLISTHPDVAPLYEPVGLWLYADPDRKLKWQQFEPRAPAPIILALRDEVERHRYEIPTDVARVIEAQ